MNTTTLLLDAAMLIVPFLIIFGAMSSALIGKQTVSIQ
jgi:hypothetical protein